MSGVIKDKKFSVSINIENIGPLKNIRYSESFSTNKTVIFAKNGSGKSFFSRTMQKISDEDKAPHDELISFDQTKGNFKICIDKNYAEINLNKGLETKISSNKYLFHVFNSDYVKNNIEIRGYSPLDKSQRSGYILGQEKIDLSKEKDELEKLKNELEIKRNELQSNIEQKLKDYNSKFTLGRFNSFKNLQSLKLEKIDSCTPKDVTNELVELERKFEKLKNFPDTISDIPLLNKYECVLNLSHINEQLKQPVIKIKLPENIEKYIANNKDFITKGVEILNSDANKNKNKCPFCQKELELDTQNLIDQYHHFLISEENKMINFCKSMDKQCEEEVKKIRDLVNEFENVKQQYMNIKNDLMDISVEWVSLKSLNDLRDLIFQIREQIIKKLNDVTISIDMDDKIKKFNDLLLQMETDVDNNNKEIKKINKNKNDIAGNLSKIKENIIKNVHIELFENKNVEEFIKKKEQIKTLEDLIKTKEEKVKIDKENKILETLKYFLNFFFKEKYSVSNNFIINFKSHDVTNKLGHILSDGEKTIVAFCHYLAEVHTKISHLNDYENLFFIIDDPISSLDSDYVYSMVQLIRHIKEHFAIKHERYIILTHNTEFMSILKRNNICSNYLEIKNGKFLNIKDNRFNIPYMSHLEDLYNIYNGNTEPCHTTPNSMRQVLEGIRNFISPSKTIEEFIKSTKEFKCTELYSLIQDGSHGDIFCGITNDSEIKQLIKCIISYIKNSLFCDQLDDL